MNRLRAAALDPEQSRNGCAQTVHADDVGGLRDQLQAQRDREQRTLAELGNLS